MTQFFLWFSLIKYEYEHSRSSPVPYFFSRQVESLLISNPIFRAVLKAKQYKGPFWVLSAELALFSVLLFFWTRLSYMWGKRDANGYFGFQSEKSVIMPMLLIQNVLQIFKMFAQRRIEVAVLNDDFEDALFAVQSEPQWKKSLVGIEFPFFPSPLNFIFYCILFFVFVCHFVAWSGCFLS